MTDAMAVKMQAPMIPQNQRDWSTGTFGCLDDIGGCCYGYFCAPCLFCRVAGKVDESGCAVLCCVPGGMISLRTKIRTLYGIQGTICNDCICAQFCGLCVLCQMDRELNAVGL